MVVKVSLAVITFVATCSFAFSIPANAENSEVENAEIERVINASIGWALDKNLDLLYCSMAQDSAFFIFHPNDNTIVGFDAFKHLAETVFMNPAFKATDFAVRELRINRSQRGDVAWFSALLDDHGEWNGEPTGWDNCRWTGVLEKRDGNWVIAQMHFSFETE
ncbi:MAG: nuclear transport factor 2 family protein [bacterium]